MKIYESAKAEIIRFSEEDLLGISAGENGVEEIGGDLGGGIF